MSFLGLDYQTWTLDLVAGQDQKTDPRALRAPMLAKAIDVSFPEVGGIQLRYPFASLGADILGGGTLSDIRRIVENGSELLCFTKDALYSWNAQLSKWVEKGTHLAIKLEEQAKFVTTGDQTDCDRAELDGLRVYAWMEDGELYCAAQDKETGSVIVSPTAMSSGDTVSRPRLLAMQSQILLFYANATAGKVDMVIIDPTDPTGTLIAGNNTSVSGGTLNSYYDVCRIGTSDSCAVVSRLNPTTSYNVVLLTAGAIVTSSTKARTALQPVAIACSPDGAYLQIVRTQGAGSGPDIKGDLLDATTLADTAHVGTAVGTVTLTGITINQITAAYKTTQVSSQYRCYVFWSYSESELTEDDWGTQTNWVDTGGNLGTQADFVDHVGLASHAWCHDDRIYVWTAFAATSAAINSSSADVTVGGFLQNTYFLYRDDGFLCGKAAPSVAGGYSASTGHLPGVATIDTGVYAWCGVERRRLNAGDATALQYSARAPHDIVATFDSNEARCTARLGQTLYISGAEILQYDGRGLYELGFHVYPWYYKIDDTGSGGDLDAGTYAYKPTWRWDNARGERERSTTATTGTLTAVATDTGILTPFFALNVTHKTGTQVALEWWRTKVDPTDDAPFYLVTDPDPTNTVGDNCYVANDDTAMTLATFNDNYADATAGKKESFYENGGVLQNFAPPAGTILYATDTRLFLAGISGDPDRVWYSKQRGDGQIAAFHPALVANVPPAGGRITAVWTQQNALVVAREHALYVLPGQGYSNVGAIDGSQNYGPAQEIPGGIGCESQDAFAVTEAGTVFKSAKGWYLLDNGFGRPRYIGQAFSDYDDETVLAVHVTEAEHEVRALTANRMLVFNTLIEPWRCSEWTIDDGLHACMWNGTHVYVATDHVHQQQTDYTTTQYGFDIETAWIQFPDGCLMVNHFQVLGEYRSSHRLQVRCARDHWKDGEDVYFQDKKWTVSPTTVGARYKVRHAPSTKRVEAIKIRLTALDFAEPTPPATGEAARLTSIQFELGFERGLNRQLPTAQRQ